MDKTIKGQLETMNQQIKELASIYRSAASKHGISDNEFWVWYAILTFNGVCSQQDISDMWSLPRQTVNSVVSNWVKKGFVYLEGIPGTRNKKTICLTDEGKKFGNNMVKKIYQAEQHSIEKMSEQDRVVCVELLGKYITFLRNELENQQI